MKQPTVVALTLSLATLAAPLPSAAGGIDSIFGCSASGSANTKGAVVGGLLGALAGGAIGKDNKVLGAALGGGLGAVLGNGIGCSMDKKAQLDAQTAFQRALDTGKPQTWYDPTSGASGKIEVLNTAPPAPAAPPPAPTASTPRWSYAQGVAPGVRTNGPGGGIYASDRSVNVRAGPNVNAAVLTKLQVGQQVLIAGPVAGGWLAIEDEGQITGYVAAALVRPVDGHPVQGAPPPAPLPPVSDCRLVQNTTKQKGGQPVTERLSACRDPGGAWNVTAV